jgi:nucleoside-diphosphate-sugar epimerase
VTGASGFLGTAVALELRRLVRHVRPVVRRVDARSGALSDASVVGDLFNETAWREVFAGTETVVHCAGLAHVDPSPGQPSVGNPHWRINADGTEAVARAAVRAGVERFIFISSIGVNGTTSAGGRFRADDVPRPVGSYAASKLEAERRLRDIAEAGGMEWVILRPPMIYGPGAPGNFGRLARLVRSGAPLPFASATNRRSFIGLQNIVSAIDVLARHRDAAGRIFLVRDAEEPTVRELMELIADLDQRRLLLFPMPPRVIKACLSLVGRGDDVDRMFLPLELDMTPITEGLGWRPPVSLRSGVCSALGVRDKRIVRDGLALA